MRGEIPRRSSLESLKKEAKRWLNALRANSEEARARFTLALGSVPDSPTLRDVQHALAREHGFGGWATLKEASISRAPNSPDTIELYETKAQALLDAYRTGTPDALERHYNFTWHRRAWPAMRSYVQLDLGLRPTGPDDDVEITLDDARYLIAIEHGFANWDDLCSFVAKWPASVPMTTTPMRLLSTSSEDAETIAESRDWNVVLRALAARPDAALAAHGQMTDDMLEQVSRIENVTALQLGNSHSLTDDGIRHLARLKKLRHLNLSQTGITDRGLEVMRELPALELLSLVMTAVTDAGMANLAECRALRQLNLMWTNTGDGAIRALSGKKNLTHFWSGNALTDAGLALLHDLPVFAKWHGGEVHMALLSNDTTPNQLTLRGSFTDRGMEQLRGLDGLFGLSVDDKALSITARGLAPLTTLPHLAWLSVDAKDDWMPYVAEMPALRFLSAQDTTAGDDGFTALSKSRSIEFIWGRRSHNLRTRGFTALSRMPKLRGLSLSCLNVDDAGIAALPEFPALRELMPMDIPDAGYRHIGKCAELEALILMYCRDTTDAATEQIAGLSKLNRYFNSYTVVTDRTPEVLSKMDSLERITFDACHNLTNEGVAKLARLPHLKELRVSGKGVTPEIKSSFPPGVTVHYSP
jgi:hypothetical protein